MIRYTLRQIECALAVAELGTVAAAARALGLAQPSLSAALMKLEDLIGLQLFIRHHAQGMVATPEGRRFLAEARNLLASAADLQRQAGDASGPLTGELALGCFSTLAPVFLPRIIKEFSAAHPGAGLRISDGSQDSLLAGLREGRCDAALLYEVDLPGDIAVTRLVSIAPHVLLPADHPLAARERVALAALRDEPFILLDVPPSRTYFSGILEQAGLPSQPAYSSPSLELVRGLVGQGLGFSILVTRPHGDHTYDGRALAARPIDGPAAAGDIGLARLKSVRPTRLALAFEEFAAAQFAAR